MLVIGSVALSKYIPGIRPKDVDVLCKPGQWARWPRGMPEFNGRPLEVTVAAPGSTDEYLVNTYEGIAPFDVLYWLKMSHRFKKNSPHFLKTMRDIQLMRAVARSGMEFGKEPTWFKQREIETYTATPKLNVSKSEFFDVEKTGVVQHYDHDWLHTVVARVVNGTTTPSYTLYMKDGAAVACDINKFYSLPAITRLHGVIEESMVLALERSLIPSWINYKPEWDGEKVYKYALQKVCTSITGGWFREFAWENYDRAIWNCPENYWTKCLSIITKEGERLV